MNTNIKTKFQDAIAGMRNVGNAFKQLSVAMKQATKATTPLDSNGVPMKADKPGTKRDTKKTQPGATHRVNRVFLGRKIYMLTHAKYRRGHLGVVTKTPNYLLSHPAPKGRNVQHG